VNDITVKELNEDGKLMSETKSHREYIMDGDRYFVNLDPDTGLWVVMGSVYEYGYKCGFIGCNAKASYIQENRRCCISHLSKIKDSKTGKTIRPALKIRRNA